MAIETLLHFRSLDSTENINARLAGLVPKGIIRGGLVVPEPNTLQVRIKGTTGEPWVFLAIAEDGMVLRNQAEEMVLPVVAGLTNAIVLRARYVDSGPAVASIEVMTLGAYETDADKDSLIRLASVTPAVGATSVDPTEIDLSFRDSIEGFARRILRGVVPTTADLPGVSGSPATAEINFIGNDFVTDTSISFTAGSVSATFQIVPPITFRLAGVSTPGLSRINPSQRTIASAIEAAVTGVVTVTTTSSHGLVIGNQIRIANNSAVGANGIWTVASVINTTQFTFTKPGTNSPFSGTGGSLVNTATSMTVIAKTAPGITHDLTIGMPIVIQGATDPSFNVSSSVSSVIDAQTFTFPMSGFQTADSGNGSVTKLNLTIPTNGVQIGESATGTANNFETIFRGSELGALINATAIGSSIQLQTELVGTAGNSYTLSKSEPGILVGEERIVLSGSVFEGGAEPIPGLNPGDLRAGDVFVVLFGDDETIELWGFDGIRFKNLTSASTATFLDFHRRNLLENEKHLTENEQAALKGTVGTPSAQNRFVTEQDSSFLSADVAAALAGADGVPPSGANKFLTEARYRGERAEIQVPALQDFVQLPGGTQVTLAGNTTINVSTISGLSTTAGIESGSVVTGAGIPGGTTVVSVNSATQVTISNPATATGTGVPFAFSSLGERWVVGTTSDSAAQFFNVVFTSSLRLPGGPIEYTQGDFTPVTVTNLYFDTPFSGATELDPSDSLQGADSLGIYPKLDATILGNPTDLYVKLSDVPDNGDCTILYSRARPEKIRPVTSDMLMGPQKIFPAGIKSIENKALELRFNAGIGVAGTVINFPANLFSSSNLQNFTFKRAAGGQFSKLTSAFYVDFSPTAIASGTPGIVNTFTPVAFPAANQWTKYALTLNQEGKVTVYPVEDYAEKSTDTIFGATLSAVVSPNLAFTKGEWLFASVGVLSNGTNTSIVSLTPSSIELYPFQGTNSRDYGAEILCGDGTVSFGHFTGPDAHIRASRVATAGDTVKLLPGTYDGQWLLSEANVTIDYANGAVTSHSVAMTSLSIPDTDVNFSTDTFTSIDHGLSDGHAVTIATSGTLPGGLSSSVTYYVVGTTDDTFQLALTAGGSAVNLSSSGTGTHTVETAKIAVNINAANITLKNPRFADCDVALNLTQNASSCEVTDPRFEPSVMKNFTASAALSNPYLGFKYSTVATYTCTDGTTGDFVGDFNSADALNDVEAVVNPGDVVVIYPGTYSRVLDWTKSNVQVKGHGSGEVIISGGGSSPAVTISGSGNRFSGFVCTSASVGLDLLTGAERNIFDSSVTFSDSVIINVRFPPTSSTKHFNFHPLYSGTASHSAVAAGKSVAVVTVGDGVSSWGDYVGSDGISQALQFEQDGTEIRVGKGTYQAIDGLLFNNRTVLGCGDSCVIQAVQSSPLPVINDPRALNIIGDRNRFKNFRIQAQNNNTTNFEIIGIEISGNENTLEDISFTEAGPHAIDASKKYRVASGARNRFITHTGTPTGYVSWTVGDGKRSFGDFNGPGAIGDALNNLPITPDGIFGDFSAAAGSTVTFTVFDTISGFPTVDFVNTASPFYVQTLYRHVTISTAVNAQNNGSWKVSQVLSATSLQLQRDDGVAFVNDPGGGPGLSWYIPIGAKVLVLPGTYNDFIVQPTQNGIDIEAWGAGRDVIVQGGSPCIWVRGHGNRLSGFRCEDTGTGIRLSGTDNVLEKNQLGSQLAVRYQIDAAAIRNSILDALESHDRTAITVSTQASRADFVGSSQTAIQAAVNAAAADPHIKRVYIGAGTYTLTATVNIPANITIFGAGYDTLLTSAGGFAAFTLNSGGQQTISGIRFNTFTNSLTGPATGVFAYGNWLIAAPINANITSSSTADNL